MFIYRDVVALASRNDHPAPFDDLAGNKSASSDDSVISAAVPI